MKTANTLVRRTGMVSLALAATSMIFIGCSSSNFGGGTGTKPVNKPAAAKPTPAPAPAPVAQPPAPQPQTQNQTPAAPAPVIVQQQPAPIIPADPAPIIAPPVAVTPVTQPIQPMLPPTTPAVQVPPVASGGMIRVPIIGIVNMDSKYQITNEGYRVSIEDDSGKVLAAGPLNIESVMNGQAFDAQGSAYGKPYLLGVTSKYLAPEITSGQISGARKARVSICMPQDVSQAWDAPVQCRDLNKFVGHSNGSNTFVRLASDINVQKDQVGITAIRNSTSKGDCGTASIPCASVMHPIFGFAAESGSFNFDNASPLVLDMNKNGKIDLVSAWRKHGPVAFDIAGDSEKIRMGWIAPGDALLALDVNKNGRIDSGRELFGESSERIQRDENSNHSRFANGFMALAQYDRNQDGLIDAKDPVFKDLVVWQDRNTDGVTQAGELSSLDRAAVASVRLNFDTIASVNHPNMVAGNDVKLMGSYQTRDGKSYKMADVWFEVRLHRTISQIMGFNK